MYDAKGKAAIITGSAQGLGKEFAIHLLQEGAKVCISDVNEKLGAETVKELGEKFGKDKVMFHKCDVTKEDELKALWDAAAAKLGYISIMVNNAGVNFKPGWKLSLDIMLVGVVYGLVLARERMSKAKGGQGGRIINIASLAGLLSFDSDELQVCMGYTMAKWGVVGLTRNFGLAKPNIYETEGIKCYALCPFYANTTLVTDMSSLEDIEKLNMGRVLDASEVGRALIESLKLDSNGAILQVYPDAPLMDTPNCNWFFLFVLAAFGRILKALNMKVATVNPYALVSGAMVAVAFLLYLLSLILCCLFCR